jgi:hypothetical protein
VLDLTHSILLVPFYLIGIILSIYSPDSAKPFDMAKIFPQFPLMLSIGYMFARENLKNMLSIL